MDILECIINFCKNKNRSEAAKKLAEYFNAIDIIIFIKDPELNILLPAFGFPQSIPRGKDWTFFINAHLGEVFTGNLPYNSQQCPVVAVRDSHGSVAILIGGSPDEIAVRDLKKTLEMLSPLLIQEKLTFIAESKALHNEKLVEKAERLTITLDTIRNNLTKVLDENSRLLQLTKQQNDDLSAANEELLAANEEITAGLEELNVTNSRLLSINADLDNFVYTASHDLKSPILNIEGLIKILSKNINYDSVDTSSSEILQMINLSIARFKETIKDLSEITKIGKESAHPNQWVNLNEIIQDVIIDQHISIQESKTNISIDIKDHVKLFFSKKNIKSIIYNLLSNAIKYSRPNVNPEVKFQWMENLEYNVLIVKDNGLGMDTRDKTKIFGLFKRLHSHVDGTGIGLYIVKKIIENAGGNIDVESTVGVGSTFYLYFKNKA